MAPEMILDNTYDARADLFSVGIILFQMLFGRFPISVDFNKMQQRRAFVEFAEKYYRPIF
jgi:serine/threonine protein kinase